MLDLSQDASFLLTHVFHFPLQEFQVNLYAFPQCCGSGIRCLFDPWNRDPRWVKIRVRIRDEQPGSYFRDLETIFWVKILKFFDADPGSGMGKIWIRDPGWKIRIEIMDKQFKHPGSATLLFPKGQSHGMKEFLKAHRIKISCSFSMCAAGFLSWEYCKTGITDLDA